MMRRVAQQSEAERLARGAQVLLRFAARSQKNGECSPEPAKTKAAPAADKRHS